MQISVKCTPSQKTSFIGKYVTLRLWTWILTDHCNLWKDEVASCFFFLSLLLMSRRSTFVHIITGNVWSLMKHLCSLIKTRKVSLHNFQVHKFPSQYFIVSLWLLIRTFQQYLTNNNIWVPSYLNKYYICLCGRQLYTFQRHICRLLAPTSWQSCWAVNL